VKMRWQIRRYVACFVISGEKMQGQNGANLPLEASIHYRDPKDMSVPNAFVIVTPGRRKLTSIQDTMINEQDYVELGLSCAKICRALDRGMDGKRLDDLSQSVREAINRLMT